MGITLADHYYIKAQDNYPFDLEEVTENLNYSLSYDDEHPAANCLMGQFCWYQLKDWQTARHHYEMVLAGNDQFIPVYEHYSWMLIELDELTAAEKLLHYGSTVKGISMPMLLQRMAIIQEKRKQYKLAKTFLKKGLEKSILESEVNVLKQELERVKAKLKKV